MILFIAGFIIATLFWGTVLLLVWRELAREEAQTTPDMPGLTRTDWS